MSRLDELLKINNVEKPKTNEERLDSLEAKTTTEDDTTINDLVEALDILTSIVLGDEE